MREKLTTTLSDTATNTIEDLEKRARQIEDPVRKLRFYQKTLDDLGKRLAPSDFGGIEIYLVNRIKNHTSENRDYFRVFFDSPVFA